MISVSASSCLVSISLDVLWKFVRILQNQNIVTKLPIGVEEIDMQMYARCTA